MIYGSYQMLKQMKYYMLATQKKRLDTSYVLIDIKQRPSWSGFSAEREEDIMKQIKIQQEIIANYYKLSHDKNNKVREKLPVKYAIINDKVHLAFRHYIICFSEEDLYIDLEKLKYVDGKLGIYKFNDENFIKNITVHDLDEPNAILTGNIKKIDKLELVEISNGIDIVQIDKKILDYFECNKFYFEKKNQPVFCYNENNDYIGIILPISSSYVK